MCLGMLAVKLPFAVAAAAFLMYSTNVPVALGLSPSNVVNAKFTPKEGKIHFIVGQDFDAVKGFVANVLANPAGTTSYTSITENRGQALLGLDSFVDYGAGRVSASAQTELVPDSALVIGLGLVGALEAIVNRRCDVYIDRLANWIRRFKRPVFLRIGYEFDGPWNDYDPALYRQAFRLIVLRLRELNVKNFVSVWQSATYGSDPETPITDWYPGDEVVDWMGTSYFVFRQSVHDKFLNFARAKGKPVMIAESTPQGYDLALGKRINIFTNELLEEGLQAHEIWNAWFDPFFRYITDNRDVIRAVAYINTQWNTQDMWTNGTDGYWGDSRVQANGWIKRWFSEELSKDHWLFSSTDLPSRIYS